MSKPKLAMYGAGQNGTFFLRPEYETSLKPYDIAGFIDDTKTGEHLGLPILGTGEDLPRLRASGIEHLAISLLADPIRRLEICNELRNQGFTFPPIYGNNKPRWVRLGEGAFLHHTAEVMGYNHTIGNFTVVNAFATLDGNVSIGDGTIISPYTFIGHDATIGRATFMAPRSTLCPRKTIGDGCYIGPGIIVHKKVISGRKILKEERI